MNDDTEYRERKYEDEAVIGEVRADHDRKTVWLRMDGSAWSQGFGGICGVDDRDFVASLCTVFGIADRERLVGQKCKVLREFPYLNEPILGLRSLATGRTFSLRAYIASRFPDVSKLNGRDERVASIARCIESLKRRLDDEIASALRVDADYREISGEAP